MTLLSSLQTKLKRLKNNPGLLWQKIVLFGYILTGNSYFCPCCGRHCTKFLDFHSNYRAVVCPTCGSQPRHRAFYLYLKERTNFYRDKLKVLHVAPFPMFRKQFSLLPNLDYISADLNDPSVDVKLDITNIPYPDNTFDVIICSHVLEHVTDDRAAMRELLRVLKHGGWSFLPVPIDIHRDQTFEDPNIVSPEDRLRYYWQEDHVRLYGLDYKNRLEEAGFIVQVNQYIQELSPEQIKKYGLHYKEDQYFGVKPLVSSRPDA